MLDGLFHAAGWVGRNKAVVHGLIERRREDALHHADGVGIQTLLDLAGLEGADVCCSELAEPQTSEKRNQVIAAGPFVALEGALADLVAGRVSELTLEMLTNRQPPRVGK
jgi:hypothetical protein